jgi:3-deoxy-D-manno-octulosonic-acid transferase
MNAALRAAYHVAGTVTTRASAVAARVPGEGKWLRALRGRYGVLARYAAWGATGRDATRPLLWMHAPSVGEGLQAKPVLELLRQRHPALQIAYTHYSPSAEGLARGYRDSGLVEFADYLPWDTPAAVREVLVALAPRALVFVKLDVWPELVDGASRAGVRLGLISATLSERSGRRSPWGAALLRDAYARLEVVGAIDAADAGRLRALGVPAAAVTVTGDTRYDQVWARAAHAPRDGAMLAGLAAADRVTIVAGSTWPSDERVVLDAWMATRQHVAGSRLVLAPHEPTPDRIGGLARWAASRGVVTARLDAAVDATPRDTSDLILVDRVGVLGDLYAVGDIAYVGGAFHAAGLHSVLEPAAYGVPVLVGPDYAAHRDAKLLIAAGAAVSIRDVPTCAAALTEWLVDVPARRRSGDQARAVVAAGRGAAERSAALVEGLVVSG